jgi:hypothetical protein
MTVDNTSYLYKDVTASNNNNNNNSSYPFKKAHCIYNKTFVVIDESLVRKLAIDEDNNTWFEQLLTPEGILLKIHRNKMV